jgi:hypothetical protein
MDLTVLSLIDLPNIFAKCLTAYDEEVLNYVCKLRKSGAIVNRQILIAGAKGILQQKAKNLLRENGGHIDLDPCSYAYIAILALCGLS